MMDKRKIGVFVCGCGGNISDYVDVDKVVESVALEPDVAVASTAMFTCSDATQQDIINVIKEKNLDGIVVASCSPKLHLNTFRAMAERAGLNRYVYNQVNIREQCSWTHTHDKVSATDKAVSLVRAGIAKTRISRPLNNIQVKTQPRVLIVGGGLAGMRAAISLSVLGLEVHLVEQHDRLGGRVAGWGPLFPNDRTGDDLIGSLVAQVEAHERIHLHLSAQVVEKRGSVGDFEVRIDGERMEPLDLHVGAIMVATGYSLYQPDDGELGFGLPGVVTLERFRELAAPAEAMSGPIKYGDRVVKDVVYIYCVGSRQGAEGKHSYCSRFCCSAAVHTSLLVSKREDAPRQFHLYRDLRTYGKQELMADEALRAGSMFLKFPDEEPPQVSIEDGRLTVTLNDQLSDGDEITIRPDLVVLVTGMEARQNASLVNVLKLPVGIDGFFNEIHPKLRPVETVIDGVLIAGTAQGPKNIPESVSSAMSAAAKVGALLLSGRLDLEPFVAVVNEAACTWCGACAEVCPYEAIERVEQGGKAVAKVNSTLCKGCGACVPPCAERAIAVEGCTHEQIEGMIDALAKEVNL